MNALVQRLPAPDTALSSPQHPVMPTPLVETRTGLRLHPGFRAVRDGAIENLIQLFRGDYLLSRLLLEEGRYTTIQTLLALAATQQTEDRATWLTLGRLQACLTGSTLASRNRIEALVAILERYGFIERRKVEEDLRITLLLPTARLWGADALVMEAMALPLTGLGDTVTPGAAMRGLLSRLTQNTADAAASTPPCDPQAPAWSTRDVAAAGAGHRSWHRLLAPRLGAYVALRAGHRPFQELTSRDGGYMALLLLLNEARVLNSRRVSLPYETLSNHTGVSRTHARLLMEQAEGCGFARLHAKGGRDIEVTDLLQDCADAWFADMLDFILTLG